MKRTQTKAVRKLLATIDQKNAFLRFDDLNALVRDRILLRGRARGNQAIDHLLTLAATKALGRPTYVEPQTYFELGGLWQTSLQVSRCPVWMLYDDVTERGIAGFALRDLPPTEWFFVLSRAELASEAYVAQLA